MVQPPHMLVLNNYVHRKKCEEKVLIADPASTPAPVHQNPDFMHDLPSSRGPPLEGR